VWYRRCSHRLVANQPHELGNRHGGRPSGSGAQQHPSRRDSQRAGRRAAVAAHARTAVAIARRAQRCRRERRTDHLVRRAAARQRVARYRAVQVDPAHVQQAAVARRGGGRGRRRRGRRRSVRPDDVADGPPAGAGPAVRQAHRAC
ncbi:hypothetical protein LPJ73_003502, partial [Coemansia sp. RSA 2703]